MSSGLMQYVGNIYRGKVMVFANITFRHIKDDTAPLGYKTLSPNNFLYSVIPPCNYEEILKSTPRSGRYEVTKHATEVGEGFYSITESHRDAYVNHLPGFKHISQIKIGDLVSVDGYTEPSFLSLKDQELLNDRSKFMKAYRQHFLNTK